MKKDNVEEVQEPANPFPAASPAKAPREKKPKQPRQAKKNTAADDLHLPVLVEFTYTVSTILFIFVGLAMIIISVLTGASLLDLVLRTSAALFAVGGVLLLISSQVSSGVLQVSIAEQEEARKAQMDGEPQNDAAVEKAGMFEDGEAESSEISSGTENQGLPKGL